MPLVFAKTTRQIRIAVRPEYLAHQSVPSDGLFVWAYHIRIENQGDETVQLLHRYWHITDAAGRVHEVRGPGVVGKQPVLKPGEAFEYTSGTHLFSPSGIMMGAYGMSTKDGSAFDVPIPAFSLDSPQQLARAN